MDNVQKHNIIYHLHKLLNLIYSSYIPSVKQLTPLSYVVQFIVVCI
jgi:hypothetical protein